MFTRAATNFAGAMDGFERVIVLTKIRATDAQKSARSASANRDE